MEPDQKGKRSGSVEVLVLISRVAGSSLTDVTAMFL